MKNVSPHFLPTRWSIVADSNDPAKARPALEQLCQDYWYPVYHAIRRAGHGEHEAEDLTQSFFAHMIERSTFARAERSQGRFRTFVLSCLANFLHNARDHAQAQKRDVRRLVSFDAMQAEERLAAEPVDDCTPEQIFERSLARQFLSHAEEELRAEFRHDGREALFLALWPHLFADGPDTSRAALAALLEMKMETLKSNLHRLKKRFQEILRSRAEHLVRDPDDAKEELRALQNAL